MVGDRLPEDELEDPAWGSERVMMIRVRVFHFLFINFSFLFLIERESSRVLRFWGRMKISSVLRMILIWGLRESELDDLMGVVLVRVRCNLKSG